MLSRCWHVSAPVDMLICTYMCRHVKPLLAPLIPTIWTLSCMLACVSTFGHADMCWYVPTCADMCRHVTLTLKPLIATLSRCWHVSAPVDMLISADMCQHVKLLSAPLIPTIRTLSWMLACVSTFGHADMCWYVPACGDMCRLATLISTLQIVIIYTLSGCWHVSVSGHADMCWYVPICADMCWCVPTCDINIVTSENDHLDFMCQHLWICRHVSARANMWNHLSAPLIPIIWNVSCMLAWVSKLGHADMCWYVLACADMCQYVTLISKLLIPVM